MDSEKFRPKILFVDDESGVLRGLRRLLADLEPCCEMSFAQSGSEALDLMEDVNLDVLVTDIRMPGIDGVELLTATAVRRPGALRVALSGHSDHQVILRTVELAHQYLAKPCREETLKSVMERAIYLRTKFKMPEGIRESLAGIKSVPGPVDHFRKLQAELSTPVASVGRIGGLIAADAGMSAKILQLANSAFFSTQRTVFGILEATEILGIETIRTLVNTVGIFSAFESIAVAGFKVKDFYLHSQTVSRFSTSLAEFYNASKDRADEACAAGLLHDLGKLILALNYPGEYAAALKLSHERRLTESEAEREVLGTTHGEIGAYLLGLWGLPDQIVRAAAYHHCPSLSGPAELGALAFVHIADVLAKRPGRFARKKNVRGPDPGYLEGLGLSENMGTWRRAVIHNNRG